MVALIRRYALAALFKLRLYPWLHEHGFTRRWLRGLNEFRGARLSHREFGRARDEAGQRYQATGAMRDVSDEEHFAAWQGPMIADFFLLSSAWKLGRYPLLAHRYVHAIPEDARICEYGCGAAPIAESLRRYWPDRIGSLTIADIPSPTFDFARWRLPEATAIELRPNDDEPLSETFDAIFCMTVFEHLPRPLAIARHLHDRLRPGGVLIFDYLETEAVGVDTEAALHQRPAVLSFVREQFEGNVDPAGAGPWIVRRPGGEPVAQGKWPEDVFFDWFAAILRRRAPWLLRFLGVG